MPSGRELPSGANHEPAGDPRGVDVLVAHAGLTGHAGRNRLRRIEPAHGGTRRTEDSAACSRSSARWRAGAHRGCPSRCRGRPGSRLSAVLKAPGRSIADKRRLVRDIEVVAHERRRAGPEERQVRRAELELLDGLRARCATRPVVREAERGEGRSRPRVGLRGPHVDCVTDTRAVRAAENRLLVNERARRAARRPRGGRSRPAAACPARTSAPA